jgi:hypothetical protein
MASARVAADQKPTAAQQEETAPAAATGAVASSFWRIYHNDKYGFEVKYPDGWRVNTGSGTEVDIIAIVQPVAAADEPRGSMNLAIQPNENPRKLSIKEWFAEQLRAQKATPESRSTARSHCCTRPMFCPSATRASRNSSPPTPRSWPPSTS